MRPPLPYYNAGRINQDNVQTLLTELRELWTGSQTIPGDAPRSLRL
jgi:hypothetical protein